MPAKSLAQDRLMRAVAHNRRFAQKVRIPQTVGEEFTEKTSPELRKLLPQRSSK
jgi:hypothetical protein